MDQVTLILTISNIWSARFLFIYIEFVCIHYINTCIIYITSSLKVTFLFIVRFTTLLYCSFGNPQ